jgi:hypothetical protein
MGAGASALTNPRAILSGQALSNAANTLTGLELNPSLQGYNSEVVNLENQQQNVAGAIQGASNAAQTQIGGAYDALSHEGDNNVARQNALASFLNQNTQQIGQQATQQLQSGQQGELGSLTQSLKSRNVDLGGSPEQAALAQQVLAQQQRQADMTQAERSFAQAQGGAWQGLASGQQMSGQMAGTKAKADMADYMAKQYVANNQQYGSAVQGALGQYAQTQAAFGPTKTKNLLDLRQQERAYLGAQGTAAVNQGKLGVAQQNANTNSKKAGNTAAFQRGTLKQKARTNQINSLYKQGMLTNAQRKQALAQRKFKKTGL